VRESTTDSEDPVTDQRLPVLSRGCSLRNNPFEFPGLMCLSPGKEFRLFQFQFGNKLKTRGIGNGREFVDEQLVLRPAKPAENQFVGSATGAGIDSVHYDTPGTTQKRAPATLGVRPKRITHQKRAQMA
jgi:hypothetical protein